MYRPGFVADIIASPETPSMSQAAIIEIPSGEPPSRG